MKRGQYSFQPSLNLPPVIPSDWQGQYALPIVSRDGRVVGASSTKQNNPKLLLALLTLLFTNHSLAANPMKILIATGSFPALSEPFVLDQAIGLIDRGHEVTMYAKSGNQEKMHTKVIQYDLLKKTYYNELPSDIESYDIILCQFGPRGLEFLDIKKKLGLKAKLITYFRGYDITEYTTKKGNHCYDELFLKGDFFLTNCNHFRKRAIELGCPEDKILVHASALDCEKFSYQPRSLNPGESVRLMTTGRIVEKKGIEYVIDAINILKEKHPTLEYHIVGDGYYKQKLEQKVEHLGLEKWVHFFGTYNHDELVDILKSTHIFVSPSVTAKNKNQDANPNVLKEAMALGLPVISTNHGGIPEMITDGIEGYLVLERDSKALAEKIDYLISNPGLWKEMGLAGRKKVVSCYETHMLNDRLEKILSLIGAGDSITVDNLYAEGINI